MEKINTSGPFRIMTKDEKIYIVGNGAIWEMIYHDQATRFLKQIEDRTWGGMKPKIK